MIKKILPLLLILLLTLSSCTSESATETPVVDNPAASEPEVLGYDFVIFDSDGDGTKEDIAELALGCPVGMALLSLKYSYLAKITIAKCLIRSNTRWMMLCIKNSPQALTES